MSTPDIHYVPIQPSIWHRTAASVLEMMSPFGDTWINCTIFPGMNGSVIHFQQDAARTFIHLALRWKRPLALREGLLVPELQLLLKLKEE